MISSYNQQWMLEKDINLLKSDIEYASRSIQYKSEIQIELSKLITHEERMAMVAGIMAPTLYEKLLGIAVQNHVLRDEFNNQTDLLTLSFAVNQILRELSDNEEFLNNDLILEIFNILLTGLNQRQNIENKIVSNLRDNLTQINYYDPFIVNFEIHVKQVSNNYAEPLYLKNILYEGVNFANQEFPDIISNFRDKFSPDNDIEMAFLQHLISELNKAINKNFSTFDKTYQATLTNFLLLYFK